MLAKRNVLDYAKNIRGWKTPRRIICFAVDDYGTVRTASPQAWEQLDASGLDVANQMDRFDAVETRDDLAALFEVLASVPDSRGRPAVFTAYALSANPDFEEIRADGGRYHSEAVLRTFERLAAEQPAAYEGTWSLWQEGMAKGLIRPQFHGREHFNVELLEKKLAKQAPDLLANLECSSMAGIGSEPTMPGVGFTQAFGLHNKDSLPAHRRILVDGLNLFEQEWGFRSETFTPPAQKMHPSLYPVAEAGGVVSIDKPLRCVRPMGDGTSQREVNRSGRQKRQGHVTVVRNVVFEPCKDMGFEPVSRALEQIQAAFFWGRPAIISSHRVNFGGHLDEGNRQRGLEALSRLLKGIVARWPDVEFLSVDQLVREMDVKAAA